MKTLSCPVTFEAEIKRSRFIAHAARIDGLAETLAFYEEVADPQASHNCWAWRLDHQYRFNDDGEPASTAGKPILSAIEGKGLDHVMVVVTRYFGGIKLGVGGLVRAYGGTASKCIDQASIQEIHPSTECTVQAGFGWTGQVYSALDACEANKLSEHHEANGICMRVEIQDIYFGKLKSMLRDMTRGEAVVRISD
jgi:uncharacterized YigZ family protein